MNQSTIKAELVDLADSICRLAKIEPLTIIYNGMTSANGRACFKARTIKLSDSIFKEGEDYCYAVVIHEVCHHIHYEDAVKKCYTYHGHDNIFKRLETKWLAHYGMVPIYKRSYWKYLLDMDGNIVWTTWKERRSMMQVVDNMLYETAPKEDIAFLENGLFRTKRRT